MCLQRCRAAQKEMSKQGNLIQRHYSYGRCE
ncbi:peptidase [Salmonella enterica]|uniref:Peptidase n=1 Tax=Escherichia coli TaxID=562 RepID=A0A1V2G0S8_ECOLX|nr:peptidase [Escherichia coli]EAA8106867.1 peptidase [Salmonella enterica]EAW2074835.1 peptidase [Salmonella enterica subsp. enterica]EBD0229317.1 peptidase [Salmonella enterica subsp. enterica serovar Heidelberg]EBI0474098.1 peptidase [Salmonella enterica subsp. enterica serovar Amager]EBW5781450.1 peptidase [Salmonella enterica subsp. enterica serovar Schwarzengrund]EBY1856703.1 peptidase [Salmonella enterica subsp. enterica serovar Ohio]ECD9043311.1 peptidase [Salmonella enterica subsp. 